MTDAGSLNTKFTADNSDLIRKVDQAGKSLDKFGTQVDRTGQQAKSLNASLGGLAKGLLGIVSIGVITSSLKDAANAIDDLAATAGKLNINPQGLQFLEYAAVRSDVEVSTLNLGLKRLRVSLGDAAAGGKNTSEAFKLLGLNAAELSKADLEQSLLKISRALQGFSGQDQAVIATKLFGARGGQDLLPLLRTLGGDVSKLKTTFDSLGIALDDGALESYNKIDEATDNLTIKIKGSLMQAVVALGPAITGFADGMLQVAKNIEAIGINIRNINDIVPGSAVVSNTGNQKIDDSLSLNAALVTSTNTFNKDSLARLKQVQSEILNSSLSGNTTINKGILSAISGRPTESVIPSIRDTSEKSAFSLTDEFAQATDVATVALTNFAKSAKGAADDLITTGLANGKGTDEQLQRILKGVETRPIAVNEDFDNLASEIITDVNNGAKATGASIQSRLAYLDKLSKDNGLADNTAQLKAVEEVRKFVNKSANTEQKVTVKIIADKDSFKTGIFTYITESDDVKNSVIKWSDERFTAEAMGVKK